MTMLPDTMAGWAEGGAAVLQWAPRGGTVLTDAAVPGTGRALRPPAPVVEAVPPPAAWTLSRTAL